MEKKCEVCSSVFSVKPYLANVRRHCSKECKVKENTITKNCPCCGKEFTVWKSRDRKGQGNGTWCSKACMVKAKKVPEKPKQPKKEPLVKVCEECQAVFRIPPSRLNTARWCSSACQSRSDVWRRECSERQQGEKSWRWSGGKYVNEDGYVRLKTKVNGHESIRSEHTAVMIAWMLEVEPNCPFLILVDGKPRLHQEIEVHHIDRIRTNNDRSNLLAVLKTAHAQIHHRGRKPEPWECWPRNPLKW